MTVRLRLTLWYAALLAIIMLVFGMVLYFFLYNKLYSDMENRLREQARSVLSQIYRIDAFGISAFRLPDLEGFRSTNIYMQSLFLRSGRIDSNVSVQLPMPKKILDKVIEERKALFDEMVVRDAEERFDPITLLVFYSPIIVEDELAGILQVSTPIDDLKGTLESLRFFLWMLGIFTVILSATLGWFMAYKALKPIDIVIDAARRIQKGQDLDQKIEYDGPNDEIGRLIQTINDMLGRIRNAYWELEESNRAQKRFVSDASHELRTPLTTIRGNIDLLERMWSALQEKGDQAWPDELGKEALESMRDIATEAERMSRLINDMLALARADAGYEMEKEPIALRPIVEEVSRLASFLERKAEWRPGDYSVLEGVHVLGNRDYLVQLLFIFIENAFKYTDEGHVSMEAMLVKNQAGIRISDTGIGMDKDEVPHIFERFYRADESRGGIKGTGLGLSIAKWIIDEHEGSVEVTTSPGQGSSFTIWLPVIEDAGETGKEAANGL